VIEKPAKPSASKPRKPALKKTPRKAKSVTFEPIIEVPDELDMEGDQGEVEDSDIEIMKVSKAPTKVVLSVNATLDNKLILGKSFPIDLTDPERLMFDGIRVIVESAIESYIARLHCGKHWIGPEYWPVLYGPIRARVRYDIEYKQGRYDWVGLEEVLRLRSSPTADLTLEYGLNYEPGKAPAIPKASRIREKSVKRLYIEAQDQNRITDPRREVPRNSFTSSGGATDCIDCRLFLVTMTLRVRMRAESCRIFWLLSFLVLISLGTKVTTLSRYLVLCCGLRYELHNRGLSVPSGSHGYRPAIRCQPAG